jgi:uncharacterized protein YmfQ (DUF2313 family)
MYQTTDKSTQHGLNTPYGPKTPHRIPTKTSTLRDLLRLVQQLYPTGRAWYLPEGSNFSGLHEAINLSFLRLINTAYATLDSRFPDNTNFDEDDAELWEYRFGLVTDESLTIEQRRANLLRKLSYRSNVKARQNFRYIQAQLQASGFNVGVYENIFFDGSGNKFYKTPADVLGVLPNSTQHGGNTMHGGNTEHGGGNFDVIANSNQPESFSIGGSGNQWATFFIAGPTAINTIAQIQKSREKEFRELVLKLKPAHLVAYIFINYI